MAPPAAEPQADSEENPGQAVQPFDPDAANLAQLIFWDERDSLVLVEIPDEQQELFDQLLASDDPAIDKYLVDLGAFPNAYRLQVIDYLRARFETVPFNSVYNFPEIFELDPADTDTDGYVEFKHALIAGRLSEMAAFIDPSSARTIDAREVAWGGVVVDGIPPLEFPTQVSAEDADGWINESDAVIGVSINGDARAYPIRIIAWHEMVNDTIGGVPVSLAYCTLCGSAILYDGRLAGALYRFGTSGLLYRSNKLMYDRTTRTLWNQFTGEPAWGPLVGQGLRLTSLPVVYTTWGDWRANHPDSTVLSIETGFTRNYGPGVAYASYNANPEPIFAVSSRDDRLPSKEDVYVVRLGEALGVYPIALLAAEGLIEDTVGGLDLVIVATGNGLGGRAYEAGEVPFVAADPVAGSLTDAEGGSWTVAEDALHGPGGATLPRLNGHNAFWFAIVNQAPDAVLFEG